MNLAVSIFYLLVFFAFLGAMWFWELRSRRKLWKSVLSYLPRVFISYRRDDTKSIAGRTRESLLLRHGLTAVFRDEESIPFGSDFQRQIGVEVTQATTVFVFIGPTWESVHRIGDSEPTFRKADDWVKLEVESALNRGVRLIPVLVDRAQLPNIENKPDWVERLFSINCFKLRSSDPDYGRDIETLAALARNDAEGDKSNDQRVIELLKIDSKSYVPLKIIALAIALGFAATIWHSLELRDQRSELPRLADAVDSVERKLELAQRILPVTLDEFCGGSLEANLVEPNSLMLSTARVAEDQQVDKITFLPIEEITGRLTVTAKAEHDKQLRQLLGQKVRIAVRIVGGSGKYLDGALVNWWALPKSTE